MEDRIGPPIQAPTNLQKELYTTGLDIAGPAGDQVVYLAGNENNNMLVTAIRAGDGSLYYGEGINGIFENGIWKSTDFNATVSGLTVDSVGNIAVVGTLVGAPQFAITSRLLHNGGLPQLDTSFNTEVSNQYRQFKSIPTSYSEFANAALLGRNGDLWFGGSMSLTSDGTQDTLVFRHALTPTGVYGASRTALRLKETYFYDALALPDGSVVAVGNRGAEGIIAKYTPTGQLDTAFDGDGIRSFQYGEFFAQFYSIAVAPATGNLIVAGTHDSQGFAISINPADGNSRSQWGGDAAIFNENVEAYYSIAIAQDGSTLLLGKTSALQEQVHRYTVNPTPTNNLAVSSTIETGFKNGSIAALPDGSFAVSSMTAAGLAQLRYIDSTLTLRGSCTINLSLEPRHTRLAISDDGYFVVGQTFGGGVHRPYVARFSISGTTPVIDWAWHGEALASTPSEFPYGIAAHPDGRVYVAGCEQVSEVPLEVHGYVIGLDAATGQPDPAFGSGGRYNLVNPYSDLSIPMALTVAPNGDLAVGGLVGDVVGNKLGMLTVVR